MKVELTIADNTNDKFGAVHKLKFPNKSLAFISNEGLTLKTPLGREITTNWDEIEIITKQIKLWKACNNPVGNTNIGDDENECR